MPKLTIEITEKAHSVLKERAKREERSLTQYITLLLDDVAGIRHLLTEPVEIQYNRNDINITPTVTPTLTKRHSIIDSNITEEEDRSNLWN